MGGSDSHHMHKHYRGDVRTSTDILLLILLPDNRSVGFLFMNTPENHNWYTFNQKYTDLIIAYRQMTYPESSIICIQCCMRNLCTEVCKLHKSWLSACMQSWFSIYGDLFFTTESKITDLMPKSGVELCYLLLLHTPSLSKFSHKVKKI